MSKRLTLKELSETTGLTKYALTSLRKKGLLPYIKIGYGKGRIFYDSDAVSEALEKIAENNMMAQREAYKKAEAQRYPEFIYKGILDN